MSFEIPIWPLPKEYDVHRDGSTGKIDVNSFFRVVVENAESCEMEFLENGAIERLRDTTKATSKEPFIRVVLPPLRNESTSVVEEEYSVATHVFDVLTIRLEAQDSTSSCDFRTKIRLETNETYSLSLDTESGLIVAENVFGAMRGIETFSQLISNKVISSSYRMLAQNLLPLRVMDEPRFKWRGLLVDTARHFFSVETLKRVLNGMAAMKLNTFHWHITDSQSYPLKLESLPKLAEFSTFSSEAIYTKIDIADIVSYANDRGIRVVPEIDMPSHSASFGLAYPNLTIRCDDVLRSASLSGDSIEHLADRIALHPLKNETYVAIQSMMSEILPLFQDSYFHLGGDEMNKECLESDSDVKAWRLGRADNWNMELQKMFTIRVMKIINDLQLQNDDKLINLVMWDEITNFIDDLDMSSSFERLNKPTVQFWRFWKHDSLSKAIETDHHVVISSDLYLDYLDHTWETFYTSDMSDFSSPLVLGGEACSWSETVDESNIDERIFQRLPAIAERLWSPANVKDKTLARERLSPFLCRLRSMGIRVAPVESNFCVYSFDSSSSSSLVDDNPDSSIVTANETMWFELFLFVIGAVAAVVLMRTFRAINKRTHVYSRVDGASSYDDGDDDGIEMNRMGI